MADLRSIEQRRKIMQSVGTVHTGAEMVVRQILHALGYRYRLHGKTCLENQISFLQKNVK